MAEIELHPGIPFCDASTLNRIARQQGLCLAIAQASVYDEICRAVTLPAAIEEREVEDYLQELEISTTAERESYLQSKGWSAEDLLYFATRSERLERFQQQMFDSEVEVRFLDQKLERDQISYSLIRVEDGDLAFELHQRLLDGEADFAGLAQHYSLGSERERGGCVGPVALNQAHDTVVHKLRTSRPGELLAPFFLEDVWLILRLDDWQRARLDGSTREELREELFEAWLDRRVMQLLAGEVPGPLPSR